MSDDDELCEQCGHPWNPHVLVATLYDPAHGGLIFCDYPDCPCESTWTVEGDDAGPWIPSPDEVEDLRLMVQYGDDPTEPGERDANGNEWQVRKLDPGVQ